jgi:hypothetical protein
VAELSRQAQQTDFEETFVQLAFPAQAHQPQHPLTEPAR